jgi:plastocyanin/mono/diheme cytochrome c family protein
MSKRAFATFGVVAVIGILVIPFWALQTRGSSGAAERPIPSSDKTAQSLFQTNCGACHTLAAGGTDGVVGPNLDTLLASGPGTKDSVDANCQRVLAAVDNGVGGRMPAGILEGANADLVASFVARNVAYINPGPTPAVPASQVECKTAAPPSGGGKPNGGKPAGGKPSGGKPGGAAPAGGASTLKVSADPSGQLAFQQGSLSAKAGNVTVDFSNQSPIPHNVTISDSSGKTLGATQTITGSTTSTSVNLKPGKYTYFCSVDAHEQAGMKGTLTVK